MFFEIDSAIGLAFLRRYSTPESIQGLGETRLEAFLTKQGYSGQRSAAELLERLRAAPVAQTPPAEAAAKQSLIVALVEVLEPLVKQIAALTKAIKQALDRHPDGPAIASFPRAGRINAAQILAELGDDRARFPSDDQLAAEAGVAPVTRASGKHRGVAFRAACNKRLRRALTCFADNSRRASDWAGDIYRRARARGCKHPHAVRILARAWVRVLWRCWRNNVPYDPARHRAAVVVASP